MALYSKQKILNEIRQEYKKLLLNDVLVLIIVANLAS